MKFILPKTLYLNIHHPGSTVFNILYFLSCPFLSSLWCKNILKLWCPRHHVISPLKTLNCKIPSWVRGMHCLNLSSIVTPKNITLFNTQWYLNVPCCLEKLTLCSLFNKTIKVCSLYSILKIPCAFGLLQLLYYFTLGKWIFTVQKNVLLQLLYLKILFTWTFMFLKYYFSLYAVCIIWN